MPGRSLHDAWQHATTVAEQAARDTAQLAARLERARSHGDKSIGTPDPGAVSLDVVDTFTTTAGPLGDVLVASSSTGVT